MNLKTFKEDILQRNSLSRWVFSGVVGFFLLLHKVLLSAVTLCEEKNTVPSKQLFLMKNQFCCTSLQRSVPGKRASLHRSENPRSKNYAQTEPTPS